MDERRGNVFSVGLVTNRGKADKYIVLCDGDSSLTLRDVIYFQKKPTKQKEGLVVPKSPEEKLGPHTIIGFDRKNKMIEIDGNVKSDIVENPENWQWVAEYRDILEGSQFAKHSRWKGHYNESAIHMATRQCIIPVVRKLLELGADPNERNYRGETPLHICFRKIRSTKQCILQQDKPEASLRQTASIGNK